MIQRLYQSLKKTQPELFTKRGEASTENVNSDASSTAETNSPIETDEVDDLDEPEEIIQLTPAMEHAEILYQQGMKLINMTMNRQYDR